MSEQTGTPFNQGPLTPENVTARILVLEHLLLNVAGNLEAVAARHHGLTLDGVRNRLETILGEMLGGLLETNRGAFDAGLPYAETVIQKLFGGVKIMLEASHKVGTPPSSTTAAKKIN
ncbi:hypothetical protein ACD578_28720 (plasmid) [Microvirga sp. RSM25]|uniref:hypothetical protein n=1 Tax=Microvirga sp. RSM25 TaxID=3273802 RepID=UPI0038505173